MNFHENLNDNGQTTKSSEKTFGLVMAAFFAVVAVLTHKYNYLLVSCLFLLSALVFPKALKALNHGWFLLGRLLHSVVSPIVLGLLFFGIFTLLGTIMRLFKKKPLLMGFNKSQISYWKPSEPCNFKEQF